MTALAVGTPTLDALGPGGPYRARNVVPITDVAGTRVAELSVVPSLFVSRAMSALRAARPLPLAERADAIADAIDLFASGSVAGLTAGDYEYLVSRVGGVPISVVRAATGAAVERLRSVRRSTRLARPAGAVTDWRHPLTRSGRAVWTRRGEVFAVHASGAHPGAHSLWPEALVLGYRVAVRPSRRDPFTPHRLVTALRQSGFGPDHVMLLPTEHAAGEAIVRGADLAYGGDDVLRKHVASPSVLQQRPGRSKILLAADADWRKHVDTIVESVSYHGGTGCVNTTAVFVEGDPASVAEAVAARLASLPILPPEDDEAVLPVQPEKEAHALRRYLRAKADGTRALLGADDVVAELGDGSAALRAAVHVLDSPCAAQAGVELPFPCVWFAPWSRAAGLAPLRETLALTALTRDAALVDDLIDEPSIGNVYVGDHPTHWTRPGLPHDGYLADFLMRTKTVIRDEAL